MIISKIKILILAFIVLMTLEICSRVDDYLTWGASLFSSYSSSLLTYTDKYGKRNRPNIKFEKWNINNHGFRGGDFELEKSESVGRIFFLGASETFGLHESPDMEYPAQVKKALHAKSGNVEVVNAASPGMPLFQMVYYYREYISKFKPDIVFVYPTPAFYLFPELQNRIKKSEFPVYEDGFQLRVTGKLKNILKSKLDKDVIYFIKSKLLDYYLSKKPENWAWEMPPVERVEAFKRDLVDLTAEIKKSGAEPVLLTHAHRYSEKLEQDDKYHIMNWKKLYPRAAGKSLIDMERAANRVIRDVSNKHNLELVDLDKYLTGQGDLFFDSNHFTDAGAKAVSQLLIDSVVLNWL